MICYGFKQLKNENATVIEMASALIDIETVLETLTAEHQEAYGATVDLQQQALSGDNVSQKMKEARHHLLDLQLQVDACRCGQTTLREKMAEKIPVEAKIRQKAVASELKQLKEEEQGLIKEVLGIVATLVMACEKIEGIGMTIEPRREGPGFKVNNTPKPKIDGYITQNMQLYAELIKSAREREQQTIGGDITQHSVEGRRRALTTEHTGLGKLLEKYDPTAEVDNVLDFLKFPKKITKSAICLSAKRPGGT